MTRKTVTLFFGVLLALILSAPLTVQAAPSIFSTQDECEKAVAVGVYEVYTPKYFGNHARNPVDRVKSVIAPLEHIECVDMDTTSGRKWVVQTAGTEFRFHVESGGALVQPPYARHDCGNRVYGVSFPQPPPPTPPAVFPIPVQPPQGISTTPAPAMVAERSKPRDVCAELGLVGERFNNRVDKHGRPYCDEGIPWYKWGVIQYPVNTIAGSVAGYTKARERGAIIGGLSGITTTYLSREIAGEGNEEWGWVGLPLGIAGGRLVDKPRSIPPATTPSAASAPSGGGTGIGNLVTGGGSGIN